jgi:cytidylate kinase
LLQRESVGEQAARLDEAMRLNRERVESDRRRYVKLYNLDPFSKTNYDMILDTTNKRPEPLVEGVLKKFKLKPKH